MLKPTDKFQIQTAISRITLEFLHYYFQNKLKVDVVMGKYFCTGLVLQLLAIYSIPQSIAGEIGRKACIKIMTEHEGEEFNTAFCALAEDGYSDCFNITHDMFPEFAPLFKNQICINAPVNFLTCYKKEKKLLDKNENHRNEQYPYSAILSKCADFQPVEPTRTSVQPNPRTTQQVKPPGTRRVSFADRPADNRHTVYASAKQILIEAIENGTSNGSAYSQMINSCFYSSSGIFKDPGSLEKKNCYENNANGYYNRETRIAYLCDKALTYNLEQAAYVALHECAHHLFGSSESTADIYATGAILDYRKGLSH